MQSSSLEEFLEKIEQVSTRLSDIVDDGNLLAESLHVLRVELLAAVMCADPADASERALAAFVKYVGDVEVAQRVRSLPKRQDPRPTGGKAGEPCDK